MTGVKAAYQLCVILIVCCSLNGSRGFSRALPTSHTAADSTENHRPHSRTLLTGVGCSQLQQQYTSAVQSIITDVQAVKQLIASTKCVKADVKQQITARAAHVAATLQSIEQIKAAAASSGCKLSFTAVPSCPAPPPTCTSPSSPPPSAKPASPPPSMKPASPPPSVKPASPPPSSKPTSPPPSVTPTSPPPSTKPTLPPPAVTPTSPPPSITPASPPPSMLPDSPPPAVIVVPNSPPPSMLPDSPPPSVIVVPDSPPPSVTPALPPPAVIVIADSPPPSVTPDSPPPSVTPTSPPPAVMPPPGCPSQSDIDFYPGNCASVQGGPYVFVINYCQCLAVGGLNQQIGISSAQYDAALGPTGVQFYSSGDCSGDDSTMGTQDSCADPGTLRVNFAPVPNAPFNDNVNSVLACPSTCQTGGL